MSTFKITVTGKRTVDSEVTESFYLIEGESDSDALIKASTTTSIMYFHKLIRVDTARLD